MGSFSCICNKCNRNVRGGELCVIRHVRHGEILGETKGVYKDCGRVYDDDVFRSFKDEVAGINSHKEICRSEMELFDSKNTEADRNLKIYNGETVGLHEFSKNFLNGEELDLQNEKHRTRFLEIMTDYMFLPDSPAVEAKSGTVMFHEKCYDSLTDEEEYLKTKPSEGDPDQGWGSPRPPFRPKSHATDNGLPF